MTDVELLVLHSDIWNHLTVCKQMSSGLFKMLPYLNSIENECSLVK